MTNSMHYNNESNGTAMNNATAVNENGQRHTCIDKALLTVSE